MLLASRRSCHGQGNWYLQEGDHRYRFSLTSHEAADSQGRWAPDGKSLYFVSTRGGSSQVWKLPLEAGGPHVMTIVGKTKKQIQNVLVGEVWLCSGQSNMAMSVSRSANFPEEQAAAEYPQIRMFTVNRVTAETPQERCQGTWQVCTPDTVGNFSATAYFFGREVHQKLGVPVGLINSSVGGTAIEAYKL